MNPDKQEARRGDLTASRALITTQPLRHNSEAIVPNGTATTIPAIPADIASAVTDEVLSLIGHLGLGWQTREFSYTLTVSHIAHDDVPGSFTLTSTSVPVGTATAVAS